MTSTERTQKFHTDDVSLRRSGWCFWLAEGPFPHGTTNQKHYHLWVVIRHQYGISALVPDVICGKKTVVAPRNVSYFLRLDSRLKIKTAVYFFNKYWLFQLTKVRIEMKIVLKDLPELTCTTWRCYRHQMVKIHKGAHTTVHPCSTDQPNRVLRRVRHLHKKLPASVTGPLRPSSDAELFMSRTWFELRPTQII